MNEPEDMEIDDTVDLVRPIMQVILRISNIGQHNSPVEKRGHIKLYRHLCEDDYTPIQRRTVDISTEMVL